MVAGILSVALICLGTALVAAGDTRAGAAGDAGGARWRSPEGVSGLVLLSSGVVLAALQALFP